MSNMNCVARSGLSQRVNKAVERTLPTGTIALATTGVHEDVLTRTRLCATATVVAAGHVATGSVTIPVPPGVVGSTIRAAAARVAVLVSSQLTVAVLIE